MSILSGDNGVQQSSLLNGRAAQEDQINKAKKKQPLGDLTPTERTNIVEAASPGASIGTANDMFDIEEKMQNGATALGPVSRWHQDGSMFSHGSDGYNYGTINKDNFSSILGSDEQSILNTYRKRKTDQQATANQGMGQSQSILGGTVA